jgi:hypothetical protein
MEPALCPEAVLDPREDTDTVRVNWHRVFNGTPAKER